MKPSLLYGDRKHYSEYFTFAHVKTLFCGFYGSHCKGLNVFSALGAVKTSRKCFHPRTRERHCSAAEFVLLLFAGGTERPLSKCFRLRGLPAATPAD